MLSSNAPHALPVEQEGGGPAFSDEAFARLRVSAERACALLKALAHADRLVLLCKLTQGEFCVSALEAELGIHQPTLSQQLGVLRQEGLVETRRDGKRIHYRLASGDALAVLQVLHQRLCASSSPATEKTR